MKCKLRLLAFLLTIVTLTSVLIVPVLAAVEVKAGFGKDFSETFAEYSEAFNWDSSLIREREWEVTHNGQTDIYSRRAGYQSKFFEDIMDTTKKYLGLSLNGFGNGNNIVAVALAEVGKEDSLESPGGSNDVKYNTWYYGRSVSGSAYPWCAAFVAWCADQCGYIDSGLFARSASCWYMYDYFVNTLGFDSHSTISTTSFGGSTYSAVPGDILFFIDSDGAYGHIGIISEVGDTYINVVEGNTSGGGTIPGGGVAVNTYSRGTSSRVDNGYIVNVIYPSGPDAIYNFLKGNLGYNSAAACGVLANIEKESNFDPTIEEHGNKIGYGICQWSFGRRTQLVQWCEENGYDYTTLEGQLWFLKYELEGTYRTNTHEKLLSVQNNMQGAYEAGYVWCYYFERPKGYASASVARGNLAMIKYWPIYGIAE